MFRNTTYLKDFYEAIEESSIKNTSSIKANEHNLKYGLEQSLKTEFCLFNFITLKSIYNFLFSSYYFFIIFLNFYEIQLCFKSKKDNFYV